MAVLAVLVRLPLLFDDPFPPGNDGPYYVLQARSWAAGEPLFADRSLVFPLLALLGTALGDAVLGNKLVACALAALAAAGGAVAAGRWWGSWAAAVTGVWWALSPLHLGLTAEFLKNEAGLALFAWVLAEWAGPARWRRLLLGLALLGATHKLMVVLGLAVVGGGWLLRHGGRRAGWLAAAAVAVAALGVLRPVDLARVAEEASLSRWQRLSSLPWPEWLEVLGVHLAPLLALPWWRRRPELLGLALVCTAPGLPMAFDGTAWRLVLLGFVPLGLLAGASLARSPGGVVLVLLALGGQSVVSALDQARREPDYAAWSTQLDTIRAVVPADGSLVAHRGLCGFLWSHGERRCENFTPAQVEHTWRVAYGIPASKLAPYGPLTPLLPGYVLLPEVAWQRFAADHRGQLRLLEHPLNPWQPRPDYVFAAED